MFFNGCLQLGKDCILKKNCLFGTFILKIDTFMRVWQTLKNHVIFKHKKTVKTVHNLKHPVFAVNLSKHVVCFSTVSDN